MLHHLHGPCNISHDTSGKYLAGRWGKPIPSPTLSPAASLEMATLQCLLIDSAELPTQWGMDLKII